MNLIRKMLEKQTRLIYFDSAKGFAIYSVILVHLNTFLARPPYDIVHYFVNSYFLSLFFLISGYFAYKNDYTEKVSLNVKTDDNKAKAKILIDDDVEKTADSFALNEMIPEKIWQEILENYDQKEFICQREQIPLCFLYGRLAYTGKIHYSSKEYNRHKEMI